MTNKMTTSGSRALVPGVRCPIPSLDLRPQRFEAPARLPPSSELGRSRGGKGQAPPARWALIAHDKEPQPHPACAESLFSKAPSDGSTSLRALLKDVKISNHRKVNISKLALFRIHHIFKNPLNSISPLHPPSFALLGLECFSLI